MMTEIEYSETDCNFVVFTRSKFAGATREKHSRQEIDSTAPELNIIVSSETVSLALSLSIA